MSIDQVVAKTMELTGYWDVEHMSAAKAGVQQAPYVTQTWAESVSYRLAHRLNLLAKMGPLPAPYLLRDLLREVRDQGYC